LPGSGYPAILELEPLHHGHEVAMSGPGGVISAVPFRLVHGPGEALGFRFGNLAYAPDVNRVPDESLWYFQGLEVLIIDALRYTAHPTHFSVGEALDLIERVSPARAILTNLHTDLDYAELKSQLPPNVEPAFDGLRITAPVPSYGLMEAQQAK
jgi:phosphoribosyl 1,2-cyclic phosphate phosphodiesterase